MVILLATPLLAEDLFIQSWEQNFSIEGQKEVIQCFDVGDLDDDGIPEIVLGMIIKPTAGIQTYMVRILSSKGEKKFKWDSTYPINNISIADIDDDDTPEILVSSADLYVLSNQGKNLNYSPIGTVVTTAIGKDIDNDGKNELLIGTRDLICKSETLNWTVSVGSPIRKILVSDINWDGVQEIIMLTTQNVYVIDKNGVKLWISPATQNLKDVAVANIDEDRNVEILFSTDNKHIFIWEAREDGLERDIDLSTYTADLMEIGDVTRDGKLEIIVASSKLRLEILDLEGNTLWQYRFTSVGTSDVFMDMAIPDLTLDGWPDILLSHTVINLSGALDSYLYFLENQIRIAPSAKTFDNYNRGVELFNEGDYSQALDYFTQAMNAFQNAGNQEMVETCQSYIDRCTDLIAQQEEADTLFSDAETAYQEENYEEAQSLYERAQSLYESLGNDQQVQAVSDRLTEIQQKEPPEEQPVEEQPEEKRSFLPVLIVLMAILIGGGFIALKYLRKPHLKSVTGPAENHEEIQEPAEKGLEELEEKAEKIPQSAYIRKRERELKAQFVYGEINRKQYQEELRKLYEEESGN
jgi:tetratricopeptide (TPR) repeat protein